MTTLGVLGGYFLIVGHGLISSCLFYYIGCVYDRFGRRRLFILRGLINLLPSYRIFFFFSCIGNISCPPRLSLFSEILIVSGLLSWRSLTMFYIFFCFILTGCYRIVLFSLRQHGGSRSLLIYMDGGLLRDLIVFFFHLVPFFFLLFNLFYFI